MKKQLLAALSLLLATLSPAYCGDFRIFKSSVEISERGRVETIVIQDGNYRFSFIPPNNFAASGIDGTLEHKMSLLSKDDAVDLSVQITKNSPGILADDGTIKSNLALLYPGCAVIRTSAVHTPNSEGKSFDVFRIQANYQCLTRVIYLPYSEGTVEINITATSPRLEKEHATLNAFLNSFQIQPVQSSRTKA